MALVPCRECGRDVSTEAATCPRCGVARPTRRRRPSIGRLFLYALGGLFALMIVNVIVSAVVAPGKGPSVSTVPRQNLASRIGTDCRLASDAMPVAFEAALVPEIVKMLKVGDRDNFAALLAARKIAVVGNQPRARIVDSDWTNDAVKVRLLEGGGLGLEGWLHHGLCK